jgi:hypothetical protein
MQRGLFGQDASADPDPLDAEEPLLSQLYLASLQGRVASGPRAGQRVLRLGDRIDVEELEAISGPRCASVRGFSLHADVCVPARDRNRAAATWWKRYTSLAESPAGIYRFRLIGCCPDPLILLIPWPQAIASEVPPPSYAPPRNQAKPWPRKAQMESWFPPAAENASLRPHGATRARELESEDVLRSPLLVRAQPGTRRSRLEAPQWKREPGAGAQNLRRREEICLALLPYGNVR